MPLETGTYITDLVATNPAHTDSLSQADAQIRLIKALLRNTLVNFDGAVNITPAQLNQLITRLSVAAEPTLGFERSAAGVMSIVGGLLRGNGAVPPGMIAYFAGDTAPTGWLVCDQQSYATSAYPDLFAYIGYKYGGSGANFNVPGAKNRYFRHRDAAGNAGLVGTPQSASVGTHGHAATGASDYAGGHYHTGQTNVENQDHVHPQIVATSRTASVSSGGGFGVFSLWQGETTAFTNGANQPHVHTFVTSTEAAHLHAIAVNVANHIGIENRPESLTLLACIKT